MAETTKTEYRLDPKNPEVVQEKRGGKWVTHATFLHAPAAAAESVASLNGVAPTYRLNPAKETQVQYSIAGVWRLHANFPDKHAAVAALKELTQELEAA